MPTPVESSKFRKDVKRMKKRGKDMNKLNKLKELITLLLNEDPLPVWYQAHPLKGNWLSFWDAHIEPDWILIYLQQDDELLLARTGTHADIFDS